VAVYFILLEGDVDATNGYGLMGRILVRNKIQKMVFTHIVRNVDENWPLCQKNTINWARCDIE
jgi:hypothetical protein